MYAQAQSSWIIQFIFTNATVPWWYTHRHAFTVSSTSLCAVIWVFCALLIALNELKLTTALWWPGNCSLRMLISVLAHTHTHSQSKQCDKGILVNESEAGLYQCLSNWFVSCVALQRSQRWSTINLKKTPHTLLPIRLHCLWMMLPSYPQIIDSSRAFSSHIMKYLAGVLKSHIPYVTVIRLLRASQISGFTITLQCLCEGFDWCTTSVSRHSVCSSTLDTVWRIWHLWSENFMICSSAHRTVNSPSSGASMHTSKSSVFM